MRPWLMLLTWLTACSPIPDGGISDEVNDTEVDTDGETDTPAPTEASVDVQTSSGPVTGIRGQGVVEFLGIPYAAPPVGDLRWAPPAPPAGWTEPRVLTDKAPTRCPQSVPIIGQSVDEDCLFVNVHVPDPVPYEAATVVWVHGGGFTLGEGVQTDLGTRGDRLAAAEGVIVVSLNYRLGQLGFLAHPALADDNGRVGNYGFLDQVAALQWVKENIGGFGGTPERVTILGQSAGGISVCAHLISDLSEGLFSQAGIMSGPCSEAMDEEAGLEQGLTFAGALPTPCDTSECLRATPVGDLLDTLAGSEDFVTADDTQGFWGPIVDGDVIPEVYETAFEAGDFANVPVLGGFTANEGRVFAVLTDLEMDEASYTDALTELAGGPGEDADAVIAAYPLNGQDPVVRYFDAIGDQLLTCGSRSTLVALSSHTPTYMYYFAYPDAAFQIPTQVDMGAFHSAETQYVFGHPSSLFSTDHEGADLTLYDVMRPAFASFVRSGVPKVEGLDWPAYLASEDTQMVLDADVVLGSGAAADRCAVWEGIEPGFR